MSDISDENDSGFEPTMGVDMGGTNGYNFHDDEGDSELLYTQDDTIFNQYITGEQLTLEETRRVISLKAAAHAVSGTAVIMTEHSVLRMARAFEKYLQGDTDES